jgi:hypothetical protein
VPVTSAILKTDVLGRITVGSAQGEAQGGCVDFQIIDISVNKSSKFGVLKTHFQ